MDRVLLSCAVILISQFCLQVILAQRFDGTSETNGRNEDDSKYSLFSSRLERRKRHSKDETNKLNDQELADLLEAYEDSPLALVAINGNDKLICKNIKGNKRNNFTPRLGRNIDDDLSENEKWLQDSENSAEYVIQRSPPFAPRLGKRSSRYALSRKGREL